MPLVLFSTAPTPQPLVPWEAKATASTTRARTLRDPWSSVSAFASNFVHSRRQYWWRLEPTRQQLVTGPAPWRGPFFALIGCIRSRLPVAGNPVDYASPTSNEGRSHFHRLLRALELLAPGQPLRREALAPARWASGSGSAWQPVLCRGRSAPAARLTMRSPHSCCSGCRVGGRWVT